MPSDRTLLRTGVIGTVIVALCCFTPVLVILLGSLGLAAFTGYLDYVLFPALAAFVLLTVYAVYRTRTRTAQECCGTESDHDRPS